MWQAREVQDSPDADVLLGAIADTLEPVSYTHLDVYKRQLNEVLGTTNDQQYTLVDDLSPPQLVATTAEAVIALALQQRPDLLALKLNHEADLRFSRAQHDQFLPTVSGLGLSLIHI